MTNLDSVLKSRDISLLTKVCILKAMVLPIAMYRCENWTIKKPEGQRIDAFKLWCWRRLVKVPWTAKRSNQSTLKETSPEYSLEELMLKLKLQYFSHLIQRNNSLKRPWCWERWMAKGGRGVQKMTWSDSITDSMDLNLSKLRETVKEREAWRAAAHGVVLAGRQSLFCRPYSLWF